MNASRSVLLWLLYSLSFTCYAQDAPAKAGDSLSIPSRFFSRIEHQTARLDDQLTRRTEQYLQRMARREARLQRKLSRVDSTGAQSLFAGMAGQYATLSQQMATDTGHGSQSLHGPYQAYTDSLQGMLKFLHTNLAGLTAVPPQLQSSLRQFQSLEAKLRDADQVKEFVQQRKAQLAQYLQQHTQFSHLLGKDYQGLNHDLYYYSQQVRQYKEMLNDPDKLTKEVLAILNKLSGFQAFMKQNSQLAGLFNLPSNYGDPATLTGLQTRDQVAALIQGQLSSAGPGGAAALQSSLQSAQSQLAGYKDKLSKLGSGGEDIDMPDFKPREEKTKTFWKRLEYGTNFQTTRNNYAFPTVSDFGLSVGYKLGEDNLIGIGGSYKLGLGNGIQHVAFSSQGAGLRSFIDIKIKGSFSATGGLEYNYTKPFASYQGLRQWNDWKKSGLIGISKTVSLKSKFFKKTNLQLLWDFLSYQVPKTQAVLFRIGYGLNY